MTDQKTLPSSIVSLTYNYHMTNGVKIFYREAGLRDAPVIILLHGYPSSSKMYDPLIPLLAPYYHVISSDYPGFGLSDTSSLDIYTYSFDNIAHTMLDG